jgi:predicted acetyltransferase
MTIDVLLASSEDKTLIQRLMELYLYDFTEFDGADLDAHGCFGYPYVDHYWTEKGRYPFLVRVDGRLAGFVLVSQHTFVPGNERSIAEFFIMRKYRRQGVGRAVACRVFDRLPGRWEAQEMASNTPAQQFWRSVIAVYTGGAYSEVVLDNDQWRGPVQFFDNRKEAERER